MFPRGATFNGLWQGATCNGHWPNGFYFEANSFFWAGISSSLRVWDIRRRVLILRRKGVRIEALRCFFRPALFVIFLPKLYQLCQLS